jgi:acetyl-CoA carboxylase biotin carboxyl carrier protein
VSLSSGDLEQIMKLFEQSSFGEMKLEVGDLKLHLRKTGASAPAVAAEPIAASRTPAVPAAAPAIPAAGVLPPPGADETDVLSPLLGVFYRTPKPGEPPFVEVGQTVEAHSIIGIVEVMKLMNSVRAGVSGTVIAIHAVNAEMVEFEQPLIRIRTAG